MRALHASLLVACLTCLVLSSAACKKRSSSPKQVELDDRAFTATLPAGWSIEETKKPTTRLVTLKAPAADGMCFLTFTPNPTPGEPHPDEFAQNLVAGSMKGFGATTSEPRTLATGLGEFRGAEFTGVPKLDGATGTLVSLASVATGPATMRVYGGIDGDTYVGIQMGTFVVTKEPQACIDGCAGFAASLRRRLR